MAILPTLQNIAGSVQTFATNVSDSIPIVQSAIDSSRKAITTVTKGKQPILPQAQEPATTDELVPRNIGGININPGDVGTIALIIGLIAGAIIISKARR